MQDNLSAQEGAVLTDEGPGRVWQVDLRCRPTRAGWVTGCSGRGAVICRDGRLQAVVVGECVRDEVWR